MMMMMVVNSRQKLKVVLYRSQVIAFDDGNFLFVLQIIIVTVLLFTHFSFFR